LARIEDRIAGVITGAISSLVALLILQSFLSVYAGKLIADLVVMVISIYALINEGDDIIQAASAAALIVALVAFFFDLWLDLVV